MRLTFVWATGIFLLGFGCNLRKADHLPPKKMEAVLLDITMAEAYAGLARDMNHPVAIKDPDTLAGFYASIFAHHGITQQQFQTSLNWYKEHAEDLDTVYTNISAKADKILEVESKKRDSTRKN